MRKILPYLVLNFVVSAAAVLLVLVIWDNTHKAPAAQESPEGSISISVAQPTSTLPPMNEKTIEVQTVIGPGDIENERVQLVSVSQYPVNLQGWELTDGKEDHYVFPYVTIYPGGGINLYTKAGTDSSIELYWKKPAAIWSSGEEILLRDTAGNTRAEYLIP